MRIMVVNAAGKTEVAITATSPCHPGQRKTRARLISSYVFIALMGADLMFGQNGDSPPAAADGTAQVTTPTTPAPSNAVPANSRDQKSPGGNRAFGLLPNYSTASSDMEGTKLTAKQKMTIATKDSFDYPLVFLAAAFAGVDQLANRDQSFGQGVKGYAHRLGAWCLDESIGNMMTEGVFPVMLHQDPRYFRKGTGSIRARTGYALSRVIITDKDGGRKQFDYSEWLGNATAVAISQTYHPDNRTAIDATEFLLEQVGTDALSQLLREFWPDINRKLHHRGASPDPAHTR